MEQQIREQYEKAFWDMIDQEPPNKEHLGRILEEIKQILYSFVPHRPDIHYMIYNDLSGELDWSFQEKMVVWASRFQAPVYDQYTQSWKKRLPDKLSKFLKEYYEHLTKIRKSIDEYNKPVEGKNGVPTQMKSGSRP